jgi:integrase
MGAYRDRGHWRYQKRNVLHWDGVRRTIRGTPAINTKAAALEAERRHIELVQQPPRVTVPTFDQWFRGEPTSDGEYTGRFWNEWVVARDNKPTERRSKRTVYELHLRREFGHLQLDRIGVAEIARFKAKLIASELSKKTINKILCVLSKPLKYAADCDLITRAPKIGLYKVERPEIVAWEYEQYARLLVAARVEGDEWYAAVCLAGEAGLRVGEVKALRWREDVDMIARTITVNQQTCEGMTTTPKGRTRRTIPMTGPAHDALRALSTVREGLVLRCGDGTALPDGEVDHAIARICRRAGLPVRYWHTLRHTFGTHAAMFGVNPWRLQTWLGHKRIDETMLYVHVAEHHARETPDVIKDAGAIPAEPDARVIAMLGARSKVATLPLAIPAHVPTRTRIPRRGSPQAHQRSGRSSSFTQAANSVGVPLALLGSEGGFRTPDPAVNSRLLYH